jgi:hypothetical protein
LDVQHLQKVLPEVELLQEESQIGAQMQEAEAEVEEATEAPHVPKLLFKVWTMSWMPS